MSVTCSFLFCSEEIAFYNGNLREKQTIHATFKKLVGNKLTLWECRSDGTRVGHSQAPHGAMIVLLLTAALCSFGPLHHSSHSYPVFHLQVDHLHNFIFFRFSMGFVDSIIAKCKEDTCFSVAYLPGAKRNNSRPNAELTTATKSQQSHICLSRCGLISAQQTDLVSTNGS